MGVPSPEVTISICYLSSFVHRGTIVWFQRTQRVLQHNYQVHDLAISGGDWTGDGSGTPLRGNLSAAGLQRRLALKSSRKSRSSGLTPSGRTSPISANISTIA